MQIETLLFNEKTSSVIRADSTCPSMLPATNNFQLFTDEGEFVIQKGMFISQQTANMHQKF